MDHTSPERKVAFGEGQIEAPWTNAQYRGSDADFVDQRFWASHRRTSVLTRHPDAPQHEGAQIRDLGLRSVRVQPFLQCDNPRPL